MRRVLDILASRAMSIALMAFIAISGAIGAVVPQRAALSPARMAAWEAGNPRLAEIAVALGLDRVFSSLPFLAAYCVFAAALAVATARMIASAARPAEAGLRPRGAVPGSSAAEVAARARSRGYREKAPSGDMRVLVRHGIGRWSGAVMHLGMLIAAVAGMFALAFTARGVIDLSQGEVRMPGDPYLVVESGPLAPEPELGVPMRLDSIATEPWPDGGLKRMDVTVAFSDGTGRWQARSVSPNAPLRFNGHTVYVQPSDFGDAAFLEVTAPDGTVSRLRMEFTYVPEGEVVYADVAIDGAPVLEGRWDPHGVRGAEPLALRPAGGGAEPVSVGVGEDVTVGEYAVRLAATGAWARLIVVRPFGITAVFAGFAILCAGALGLYLWVPRTLVLQDGPEGARYVWRAARLGRELTGERDAILGVTPDAGGGERCSRRCR